MRLTPATYLDLGCSLGRICHARSDRSQISNKAYSLRAEEARGSLKPSVSRFCLLSEAKLCFPSEARLCLPSEARPHFSLPQELAGTKTVYLVRIGCKSIDLMLFFLFLFESIWNPSTVLTCMPI